MKQSALKTLITCLFFVFCNSQAVAAQDLEQKPVVEVVAIDPAPDTTIGINDRVHLHIRYNSPVPLRFQTKPMRQGTPLEVGLSSNPSYLHPKGDADALAWVSFSNPTHIDEVQIVLLDMEWQEISRLSVPTDITWRGLLAETPRRPAEWVNPLLKRERQRLDYVYDPIPDKNQAQADIIFLLTVGMAPAYILLQIYMLRNFRGRWRELAAIPLISLVPMILFTLIGFGINFKQWIAFTFRCMPFALAYLMVLWLIKFLKKSPPRAANR